MIDCYKYIKNVNNKSVKKIKYLFIYYLFILIIFYIKLFRIIAYLEQNYKREIFSILYTVHHFIVNIFQLPFTTFTDFNNLN